ncbi:hypothetical protein LV85_03926 [Algoriphagus chordae]|uniref:Uncharacterized protein n=1 Tax=Algoriphagus chordae TaxID=237019 RepID=A0A2W7QV80_9BACT|nr:hypothetical protein LV85_03926 [Algoriphagus chordae]
MLNLKIEAASVFGLPIAIGRSSSLINKEFKVTGIIADNHIEKYIADTFLLD